MFRAIPVHVKEAIVTKIAEETDSLLQGWKQAMSTFTKLKAIAFRRVLELGPLFEQHAEGAQREQGTRSSGAMEIETVICD